MRPRRASALAVTRRPVSSVVVPGSGQPSLTQVRTAIPSALSQSELCPIVIFPLYRPLILILPDVRFGGETQPCPQNAISRAEDFGNCKGRTAEHWMPP